MKLALQNTEHSETQDEEEEEDQEDGEGVGVGKRMTCRRYDHSWATTFLEKKDIVDILLGYTEPLVYCWPCKVTYSVSAAIAEDEYVALGFKGMGYRALHHHQKVLRPNYFGMSYDEVDAERTTGAIVLGYAGGSAGSCVREMEAPYAGMPTDVEGNPHLIDPQVQRLNGRTIISFTIEQHVGRNAVEIWNFFNMEQISMRTMWAIGPVEGADCGAKPQMHHARGMSPLSWFNANLKHNCNIKDQVDLGLRVSEGDVVSV